MARMIDADALLEKLQRMIDYCKNDNQVNGLTALFQIGDAIMDCPTLTPPNEWVSVEERLPEESYGMVLLTNGKVVISGYRNKLFGLDGKHGVFAPEIKRGGGYMQVTYWMPLPAPPTKEE